MKFKRILSLILLIFVLFSLCACQKTAQYKDAADGDSLPFPAAVYRGNYAKISFFYEHGVDTVLPVQDTNEVVPEETTAGEGDEDAAQNISTTVHRKDQVTVSNKNGGCYSMAVSYEADPCDLDEKEKTLPDEMSSSASAATAGAVTGDTLGGYDCRSFNLNTADGSVGKVYFGNTESGYFETIYFLSVDASDAEASHLMMIVDSLRFGQYTDHDLVYDENNVTYLPNAK